MLALTQSIVAINSTLRMAAAHNTLFGTQRTQQLNDINVRATRQRQPPSNILLGLILASNESGGDCGKLHTKTPRTARVRTTKDSKSQVGRTALNCLQQFLASHAIYYVGGSVWLDSELDYWENAFGEFSSRGTSVNNPFR